MPKAIISRRDLAAALLANGLLLTPGADLAFAETAASPWFEAYNSSVRLVAGSDGGKLVAGIDIKLAPGWKTYWRNPGDSGGVPPRFNWAKSSNLQVAVPLYPAPKRLKEAAGDSIGYSNRVVFPARVVPAVPSRPVKLMVEIEYGICREICVPVEALLELELPPGLQQAAPAELAAALDQVPRLASSQREHDPRLIRSEAQLAGDRPRLLFEAEYAGDGEHADAFIEAPDGIYVPQPHATGAAGGSRRSFEVDLSTGVDPADLRGKRLTLTLTSSAGQSQVYWQLD